MSEHLWLVMLILASQSRESGSRSDERHLTGTVVALAVSVVLYLHLYRKRQTL